MSTYITKTPTQLSKHANITKSTHTHTHTHITKPIPIHTPTHYKTHIHTHTHTHTHTHITKQVKTTTVQDTHEIK